MNHWIKLVHRTLLSRLCGGTVGDGEPGMIWGLTHLEWGGGLADPTETRLFLTCVNVILPNLFVLGHTV